MREMAAPRSRVGAARRDRTESFDEERGRREIDNYPVEADKGSPKLTFPWRRCVIAICCLALFAGCASVLSGRRGNVAELSAADSIDSSSGQFHEVAGDGAASSTKRAAPNPRADPIGIGDVLKPLVEVALLLEKRQDSAELSKLPAKEPVTVLQVGAAESAERRWLRIKTASGRVGWVNSLSETGARIFSVEKKAQKARRPQRPAVSKRQQQRPPQRKQQLPQRQQRQQAKPRRPPPGAASSWGKGTQPKWPAQPGRPTKPGRFGKFRAQLPKRAVPGGFGWPKPKAARASRPFRKPQRKASRSAPKASKPNAKPPAKRQR